ncbi:hypothetical protein THAOC_29649, partial [Thalassiosira oceanica]
MPSKAQWAYQWIWGTAVPALHPGSVLSRVMLINCDADPQETRAIESVVGRGKDISAVFPNAWQNVSVAKPNYLTNSVCVGWMYKLDVILPPASKHHN